MLIKGIPNGIKEMKEELKEIHEYLQNAEKDADDDDDVKKKVKKVRRIMYNLEDVIEFYDLLRQEHDQLDFVSGCMKHLKQLKSKYDIGYSIEEMKKEINQLRGSDEVWTHQTGEFVI